MPQAAKVVTPQELERLTIRVEVLTSDVHKLTQTVGDMAEDLVDLRREMREGQDALRREMKEGQDALRREMKEGQDALRREMKEGDAALRTEIAALRADMEAAHSTLLTEITRRVEAGQTAILAAIVSLGKR